MEKDLIEAKVMELPECDICNMDKDRVSGTKAQYDAATKGGPWAYMCQDCWGNHSHGRLGTGVVQRLVVKQLP